MKKQSSMRVVGGPSHDRVWDLKIPVFDKDFNIIVTLKIIGMMNTTFIFLKIQEKM